MTTITRSPTYSTKNKPVTLTFALDEAAATDLRAWITAAPPGSEEHEAIRKSRSSRVELKLDQVAGSFRYEFTPARAGAYVIKAQELAQSTFTGGYDKDPAAYTHFTNVGSESSLTVYVADRLSLPLQIDETKAELILYVSNTTILETDLGVAEDVTPGIVALDENARTRMAIADSDVQTALDALGNTAASTALGNYTTILDSLIDELNDHFVEVGVHANDDTHNTISDSFKGARNRADFAEALGAFITAFDRHIKNDNAGAGTGSAASPYHSAGDWSNRTLFAQPPTEPWQQSLALADAWRAYEAHRASATVHSAADSTNTATALSPLLSLLRYWSIILRLSEPTAPATSNPGAVSLISGAGFEES